MRSVLCFALPLPADLLSFNFKFWLASLENIFEHHNSTFPLHTLALVMNLLDLPSLDGTAAISSALVSEAPQPTEQLV